MRADMATCPTCTAEVPATAEICPRCSTELPWASDATRLSDAEPTITSSDREPVPSAATDAARFRPRVRPPRHSDSSARQGDTGSWLTGIEAIDHGRFAPGMLLEGRYRIVGRLGRGGMGEVYRADDLKLGQPVALKFLPEGVDQDPTRLTQLHAEVRMARQVSHPNVCRVYDVGEFEGHTFLSMEYVDGEDLSSLLRRIGRLPQDRAIELARQICAGLSAAHDRGVVHRDLKPANIMLDGNGHIRLTDFGLAGAVGQSLRAGTPAYMAPEQLAGGEVTTRSDVYSLGLVFYEMFTGRRALDARNVAELIAKREQARITLPAEIVRDLDPAVDRAIMRCLEPDPAKRPASALAVAASLPGGDPLAAAHAAGETPSPEMVAAAGKTSALKPAGALGGLALCLALLTVGVVLADRCLATSTTPLPKPPLLLAERAKEILGSVGHGRNIRDSAQGFSPAGNYVQYLTKHNELGIPERLRSGRPALLQFWYRSSPTVMIPTGDEDRVTTTDPPMMTSDMSLVVMDPEGRLIELAVVPAQLDPGAKAAPANWKALFDAADLDMAAFKPAEPQWTPRHFADTRVAWTGPLPGVDGQQLRIEAGAYNGKPVYFQLISPWTKPGRMAQTVAEQSRVSWLSLLATLAIFSILVSAALVARHNLRKGRGDRRGAFHIAGFVLAIGFGVWLFNAKHVSNPNLELNRFLTGPPLWAAGLVLLLYLAVEPYIRRFWPSTVVSWSRLMARQWRDPLVGRDVLFGVALGLTLYIIPLGSSVISRRLGFPLPPQFPALDELLGMRQLLAQVGSHVFSGVLNALFDVFTVVLLKIILRREWAAVAVAIGLFTLTSSRGLGDAGSLAINLATLILFVSIVVLTVQRLGLLATVTLVVTQFIVGNGVLTFDMSRWFFTNSLLLLLIPTGLAIFGFYASRGGEPLLGRQLLD